MEVPRGSECTPCPQNENFEVGGGAKEDSCQPEMTNLAQFIEVGVKQSRKKPKPPEKNDFWMGIGGKGRVKRLL